MGSIAPNDSGSDVREKPAEPGVAGSDEWDFGESLLEFFGCLDQTHYALQRMLLRNIPAFSGSVVGSDPMGRIVGIADRDVEKRTADPDQAFDEFYRLGQIGSD